MNRETFLTHRAFMLLPSIKWFIGEVGAEYWQSVDARDMEHAKRLANKKFKDSTYNIGIAYGTADYCKTIAVFNKKTKKWEHNT